MNLDFGDLRNRQCSIIAYKKHFSVVADDFILFPSLWDIFAYGHEIVLSSVKKEIYEMRTSLRFNFHRYKNK